ncbi:unnamed protein product [Camellia sinensis]
MLFGLVSLVMGHWINQVKALLNNFPSCWLQPGMVTTDLLLSGASTKQAKFFINVLVEPAEVICPCQWIEQAHLHSIPYWLESILSDILKICFWC